MSRDLLAIRANSIRGEYDRPRITPYTELAEEEHPLSGSSPVSLG
jgi:hypothetical protein